MLFYDLDKSVEQKLKRRIVEDLSSDNTGSEDKNHSRNNSMAEKYFHCLSTLIFDCFPWF